jgi:SAM-dependent methyltransferase
MVERIKMHQASKDFMEMVKRKYSEHFKEKFVLDVGSLDVNGTNKYLFENCAYIGLDMGPGNNVDIVQHVADFHPELYGEDPQFDTIISSNAFEHDSRFNQSIENIVFNLLKPKGLFAFSCASTGTPEHGTTAHWAGHSPHTNDHYKNITESDLLAVLNWDNYFSEYKIETFGADLRFYGIRKEEFDDED